MIGYQVCWPETLYLSSLHNETTAPISGGFRCASAVTGVMQLPSREGRPQPLFIRTMNSAVYRTKRMHCLMT